MSEFDDVSNDVAWEARADRGVDGMRAWAKECEWREAEDNFESSAEYVDSLDDVAVRAGIERHYPGGVAGFERGEG